MNKYLGSSTPLVKRIRSILRTVRPIYTQGCGVFGSLGHGDDLMDSAIFEKVHLSASPDHDVKIKSVSAGWCHSAAVTDTGKLVIFGRPYDDMTIKTINRLRTFSPTLGRFYGNSQFMFKSSKIFGFVLPHLELCIFAILCKYKAIFRVHMVGQTRFRTATHSMWTA